MGFRYSQAVFILVTRDRMDIERRSTSLVKGGRYFSSSSARGDSKMPFYTERIRRNVTSAGRSATNGNHFCQLRWFTHSAAAAQHCANNGEISIFHAVLGCNVPC